MVVRSTICTQPQQKSQSKSDSMVVQDARWLHTMLCTLHIERMEEKKPDQNAKEITDFPTELNSGLNTKTYIAILPNNKNKNEQCK